MSKICFIDNPRKNNLWVPYEVNSGADQLSILDVKYLLPAKICMEQVKDLGSSLSDAMNAKRMF